MRAYEIVTVVFFTYLTIVAFLQRLRATRRLVITAAALLIIPLCVTGAGSFARDWLPLVFVPVGYWLSGLFFVAPMIGIESRLAAIDRRLFAGVSLPARLARAPRAVLELLEASYFATPALLPAGLVAVLAVGRPDLVDRYWTTVIVAEFGAFAVLPWVQTRSPREVSPESVTSRAVIWRDLNRRLTLPLTIGVNTLPSGHASGSLAVALAVGVAAPAAGLALLPLALAVSVASVVGRYHYVVDVVAGVLLALVAFGVGGILAT